MELKLLVLSGNNAGEEVPVKGPKFFIGRAEDCHLRPRSELVSRHHCAILIEEAFVAVRDFGSKNGTLVNGEAVRGERELKHGDLLKVGDLEFKVQLGVDVSVQEKPKVQSAPEAAAGTVESSLDDDLDLDKWLSESDTETLEPTVASAAELETTPELTPEEETPAPDDQHKSRKKKQEGVVGVWNKGRWKPTAEKPRDAAADALKNFFKNRGE